MKFMSLCILAFAMSVVTTLGADTPELTGKWSGNWTPQGGIPDALTIELRKENPAVLTGQFLTPAPMQFTRATFDAKTHMVTVEATDEKSRKHYRIDGKVQGTEIKGTLAIDGVKGDLLLIKWTYVPR